MITEGLGTVARILVDEILPIRGVKALSPTMTSSLRIQRRGTRAASKVPSANVTLSTTCIQFSGPSAVRYSFHTCVHHYSLKTC
jgi:hypothetical protein